MYTKSVYISFLAGVAVAASFLAMPLSVDGFTPMTSLSTTATTTRISGGTTSSPGLLKMAAESEVSFDKNLDGTDVRIGIIRTRWNEPDVKNLVNGCRKALKELNVKDENIFETTVPGSFELPLAARFLALSGTVDAIVTAGVLIKGEVSVTDLCVQVLESVRSCVFAHPSVSTFSFDSPSTAVACRIVR